MSRANSSAAVVCNPLLDLRRRPDHPSEMRSQLILGEVVDVLGEAAGGRWIRVRNRADGYAGWARAWGLVRTTTVRAGRWLEAARFKVTEPEVALRGRAGSRVATLFLGSRVIAGQPRSGRRAIELPDGRRGSLPARSVAPIAGRAPSMIERVRSLMGSPYLWGGRSPAGLDCSAFTQLVLAEQGVQLPRDARDQIELCRPLARRERGRLGDLVFFGAIARRGAHVGLYLGDGYYAHSRGRVMVSSLDSDNILCDNELNAQYRGLGRPDTHWRPKPRKSP